MSPELIPRLMALALLAVVLLVAAGPLRPLYHKVEAWTWADDPRTWVAHGSILFALGYDAAVLGAWWHWGAGVVGGMTVTPVMLLLVGAMAWLLGWYARREKVLTDEPMSTDNWMDVLAPHLGGPLGFALGLVLR